MIKFKIMTLFFVVIFLFISMLEKSVTAQIISGVSSSNISDGDTVIIAGNEFGTKGQAAPLKWENFDDGVESNSISDGGWWITTHNAEALEPEYDSSLGRAGSSFHSLHQMDCSGGSEIITPPQNFNDKIYIDFWYRYYRNGNPTNAQLKMWRIYNGDGGLYPSLADYLWGSQLYEMRASDGANCGGVIWQKSSWIPDQENVWQHLQIQLNPGDPDVANGLYKMWIDGDLKIDATDIMMLTNSNCGFHRVKFGEWQAGTNCVNGGVWTRWDDIYIDNS